MENSHTEIPLSSVSGNKSKKLVMIAIGVVIVLIIVLTAGIFFLSKTKNVSNTSSSVRPTIAPYQNNTVMATVGGQKITFGDVVKAAQEQYTIKAINSNVLKLYLNILIEREILDHEAKKLNIQVSDKEINSPENGNTSITRYTLLKQKILQSQIKNISAYTIGFWIPPLSDPQEPEYTIQRSEGVQALNEIEIKLKAGENPITVTKYIYDNYPSLKDILGLNGYIYEKTTNQLYFTTPKIYTFDPSFVGKPAYSAQLYNTLATLKDNDIEKIIMNDGSGGLVVKVLSVTGSKFTTYNQFLDAKKKELVKIITPV